MKATRHLILAGFLALLSSVATAAEPDYLTYDKFIAEVEAGSVKSVSLDRLSQIVGTYTTDGAERPFRTYGDTGSANDILLTRLLKQKNVAVTLKDQKERSGFFDGPGMFAGLAMFLVPILTLIFAIRINSKLNRLNK